MLSTAGTLTDASSSRLTASGDPIAGRIEAEQSHSYRIAIEAGQFLEVLVDQLGADVVVNTLDPKCRPILEFDGPGSGQAPEPVYLLAEMSGDHTIEVRAYRGSGGDYSIRVVTLRPSRPIDLTRMTAERAFMDGRFLRRNSGDPESVGKALEELDKALLGFTQLGDDFRRADTMVYMGGLYQLQRESRKALDVYHPAIELFGQLGQTKRQGTTWINIGWCHDNLGYYPAALEAYGNALAIHERLGNEAGVATTLGSLGLVHQALGDSQGALELHERALELWRSLGLGRGEGVALRDLGLAYERAGFMERSRERYVEALDRFERHGPLRRKAQALVDLSRVEHELGDLSASMRHAAAGLELYRELKDRRGESRALLDLGRRQHRNGDASAALETFDGAVRLAREVEDRYTAAWSLYSRASVERDLGQGARALDDLRAAIDIVERVRGRLNDDGLRSLQLASTQPMYELAVELSLALEGGEAAFEVSESGRARSLVDALARAGRDVFGLRAPDIEAVKKRLGTSAALASYRFVGEDLYVFVLTGRTLTTHRIALNREDASARVTALVDLLAEDDDGAWQPIADSLGSLLLDPWIAALDDDVKSLWIVPDGVLFDLPFETLSLGEEPEFLLERYAISYLPAVALLGTSAGRTDSTRVLVLAAPDDSNNRAADTDRSGGALYLREGFEMGPLPFSAKEARSIKARGGSSVDLRIGTDATEASVKQGSLEQYAVLHFATHGLVSRSPELSALLLSGSVDEDGFLQSREILDLKLNSELVVLSACRTARGRILLGEGVQGLVRAFFFAGTRSVMASLWDVRDDSTARLMDRFYSHVSQGRSKSDALRLAKLDLLRRKETASPRHWAGFVLVGEPDGSIPFTPSGDRPGWIWLLVLAAAAALFGVWLRIRR